MFSKALSAAVLLPVLGAQASLIVRDSASTTAAASSAPSQDPSGLGGFGVCLPKGSDGKPDPSAPCRVIEQIIADCSQVSQVDPKKEQKCLCQSQATGAGYWENLTGCLNCARLHDITSLPDGSQWFPEQAVPVLSSSYCGLSVATAPFQKYLDKFTQEAAFSTINPGTLTPTNALGTSTAVSLYFTSSALATGAASSGAASSGAASAAASTSGAAASTTAAASDSTGGVVASQTSSAASTAASASGSTTSSGNGAAAVTMGPAGGALAVGIMGVAMLL